MRQRARERGPKLVYVVARFPSVSETFILREMQGVEERALRVSVLSLEPGDEVVHAGARELARRTGLPVVFWDERLSTVAAGKLLREAGVRGAQRERKIDAAAAELILQSYLDYSRRESGNQGNE